jgi:hypothetical protein
MLPPRGDIVCSDHRSGVSSSSTESGDSDPGGVPHRVGDRAGAAGGADLVDPLDAERLALGVVLLDP